jgi:ATP-dependent HslUV protease subunit HslV
MKLFLSTTILLVRRDGRSCMAADGQVTNAQSHTVFKSNASKLKRADKGKVLVGFAGGGADALALFTRFERKLEQYQGNFERAVIELAMDWRTDRVLRQLEAQMIVTNRDRSFLVMGNGDLLEPDEDGLLAIGSGANYALAAARALLRHTDHTARRIAEEAMRITAELCVYTNDRVTFEELEPAAAQAQTGQS